MSKSLYPQILVDGWRCIEIDGSKVLVEEDKKTVYVGKTSKDEELIRNLVIAIHGSTGYSKAAIHGKNFDGVLATAAAYQYARDVHGVRVFDPRYLVNDKPESKMAHALVNDIPVEELSNHGISEEEAQLYSRIKDIIAPVRGKTDTDQRLPPFTRIKTSAFVLDSLYKDKREREEKEGLNTSGSSGDGASGTSEANNPPNKEEPKKEDSKKEESKKEEPKKEDSNKEEPKKEDSNKEESNERWNGKPYDKFKSYLSTMTEPIKQPETKKTKPKEDNRHLPEGDVSYISFKTDDTKLAEKPTKATDSSEYTEEVYAPMSIVYPTLNAYHTGTAFKSKTASESGIIPTRFHDPASGRYFTSRGKSLGFSRGGTIVVDVSGSTAFESQHVASLINNFPLATIAIYSGPLLADNTSGGLVVVACNGKYVANINVRKYFNRGCNMVDGPAISWLALQRAPRIFISDLAFTNRFDYPLDMNGSLFKKSISQLLESRATILSHKNAAFQFMEYGFISHENWDDNNGYVNRMVGKKYIIDETFRKTVVKNAR